MKSYLKLKDIFKQVSHLANINSIMMWDEAVMMPEGGGASRAESIATLQGMMQKILVNPKIKKLIDNANQESSLSGWDGVNLKWMENRYLRAKCIPIKLTEKSTIESMGCEQAWRKLREQNNWKDFLPKFKRMFKLKKEIARRYSDALQMSPYDALLDEYSPGFNQVAIDALFSDLKSQLPSFINQIKNKQSSESVIQPVGPFAIDLQKQIGLSIMRALQFDFQHGRLDVSHHPFCGGTPTDVRMTTRYNESEFISALLGICHETGHGLYEQGLPRDWIDQPVGSVNSMAMHESQSLLIEMQICCSREFYQYILPEVQKKFGVYDALSADNLYKIVTKVEPSYIRVDADEVTYPLHIILRYELEKKLFNDELAVQDLPEHWHQLMTQYLGLSTNGNFKEGVMQDVHWPSGAFGYFPSYTLGRLIAAQLFSHFKKSVPSFDENIKQGNFVPLIQWLRENVHAKASSLETNELLKQVTGRPLDSSYFIKHVENRYLS